jgi:DNA-binding NarL/FixJ family response regulator
MENSAISTVIIDDDPFYSNLIANWLYEKYKANIKMYSDAESCLTNFSQAPDIIFLDYNLFQKDKQNMDGNTALTALLDKNPKLKIVMLSSVDNPYVVSEAIKNGAADYVLKDDDTIYNLNRIMKGISIYKEYLRKYNHLHFED